MKKLFYFIHKQSQTPGLKWIGSLWLRILLIAALCLGIIFRFSGLGNKIYSHDEAFTSLDAAGYRGGEVYTSLWDGRILTPQDIQKFLQPAPDKSVFHTLSIIARNEPQVAPLFFLLAHYWMRVVGYTPAAMRSLALVFSLLSIPAMYWLSQELFQSRRTALLCTVLIGLSPYHILFAQDARPYSLWAFLTIISSAALLRALREDHKLNWGLYSFSLIIGIYSHQFFALVAIVHGLYFVSLKIPLWRHQYAGFLSASFLALLAYTPWLYNLILHWNSAQGIMDWVNMQFPWYRYIQRWALNFTSPFIDLDFASGKIIPYILRVPVIILIAGALLFLIRHTPRRIWTFTLLLCIIPSGALMLPDIILGGIRSIGGRYFVPVNVATILAVAYYLADKLDLVEPSSHTKWRLITSVLLVAAIFSGINILQAETWWNKELGRIKPEFIHALNMSDEALLIVSGYHPTNVGDVLTLGFEADPDVRIRLYEEPDDIEFSNSYGTVFWFPSTTTEAQEIIREKQLQVSEVIPNTLWRIDGQGE
jgi:uncharacterized membrane protein